jgi:hypothetical protein
MADDINKREKTMVMGPYDMFATLNQTNESAKQSIASIMAVYIFMFLGFIICCKNSQGSKFSPDKLCCKNTINTHRKSDENHFSMCVRS